MPMLTADKAPPISRDQLGQVRPPVAMVRGGDSRPFFKLTADAAARCIPNSKRPVVSNQKHEIHVTAQSAASSLLGCLLHRRLLRGTARASSRVQFGLHFNFQLRPGLRRLKARAGPIENVCLVL